MMPGCGQSKVMRKAPTGNAGALGAGPTFTGFGRRTMPRRVNTLVTMTGPVGGGAKDNAGFFMAAYYTIEG
jgi:hypothetical protein